MIGKIFKKLIGKSESKKDEASISLANNLRKKSGKILIFFNDKIHDVRKEFFSVKEKIKDLRETNYKLGLKHLEKGNLGDAIFRFRFIKKFWPDLFDAYYQLAYCLTLDNQILEAKVVLEELLIKNPDYDSKARDLLQHLRVALEQKNA